MPVSPAAACHWPAIRGDQAVPSLQLFHSCRSLEDKLEIILRSMGARDDLRLQSYVCDEQLGIARFQVSMQSPVVASEANVRELTTRDSKDELIAGVNGEPLVGPADLERFPVVWKTVSFARDR